MRWVLHKRPSAATVIAAVALAVALGGTSYAATVLPSWLWAPREGMRWLLAHGEPS